MLVAVVTYIVFFKIKFRKTEEEISNLISYLENIKNHHETPKNIYSEAIKKKLKNIPLLNIYDKILKNR